jgi:hypothetical protein
MKKLLLITISLSIAYWGVLLAVEYAWTLPIPFLVIAYIWYEFLNCSASVVKYKFVELGDRFGIKRSDGAMLSMGLGQVWYSNEVDKLEYSWTKDKEKVERLLEQLNSNNK